VRMRDIDEMVDAELKKLGVTRSDDGQTLYNPAPVIAVDHDEADIVDEKPATAPVIQETKRTRLKRLVDVLADLRVGQSNGPQI
jgi:hypothetical protein